MSETKPAAERTWTRKDLVGIADLTRSEIERVKGLPSEQHDALGKKYTDPEELFRAIESLTILRASWVKTQHGGRLPKRGDALPPEAVITVDELRAIAKASKCEYGALPVIARGWQRGRRAGSGGTGSSSGVFRRC